MAHKYKVETVYLPALEQHLNRRGIEGWTLKDIFPSAENARLLVVVMYCEQES